jgi:CrcB protein
MRRDDPGMPLILGLVAIGGALGASCRYAANVALRHDPGQFPFGDFSANLVGCLLMGIFLGYITTLALTPARATPLVATGFLGGLTTFSSYAADAAILTDVGATANLFLYVAGTLILGWLLLRFGWSLGRCGEAPGAGQPDFDAQEMGD